METDNWAQAIGIELWTWAIVTLNGGRDFETRARRCSWPYELSSEIRSLSRRCDGSVDIAFMKVGWQETRERVPL